MHLRKNTRYSVRFQAVENGAFWIVYAFTIREDDRGGRTIVGTPRMVRIVPKETAALPGGVETAETLLLSSPKIASPRIETTEILSPYTNPFIAFLFDAQRAYSPRSPTFA